MRLRAAIGHPGRWQAVIDRLLESRYRRWRDHPDAEVFPPVLRWQHVDQPPLLRGPYTIVTMAAAGRRIGVADPLTQLSSDVALPIPDADSPAHSTSTVTRISRAELHSDGLAGSSAGGPVGRSDRTSTGIPQWDLPIILSPSARPLSGTRQIVSSC